MSKSYENKKIELVSFYNREYSGSGFFDWAVISRINRKISFIDALLRMAEFAHNDSLKIFKHVDPELDKYFDYVFNIRKPLFLEVYRQRRFAEKLNPHTNESLRTVRSVINDMQENKIKPTESILVGYFIGNYGHQFTTSASVKEWVFWMILNNDKEIYGERKRPKEIVDKEYSNIYNTIMNKGDLFDLANNSPSYSKFRK